MDSLLLTRDTAQRCWAATTAVMVAAVVTVAHVDAGRIG